MTDSNHLTVKREKDPFEVEHPEYIREIMEKMRNGTPLTYSEAVQATRYLRRVFDDIADSLSKAYAHLGRALAPMINAATYLDEIRKQGMSEEDFL